jgi:nicotinate-nucleotide adenylyltransferase
MRVGLLGGTFDPIHNGHLELARAFARRLSLDEVVLMPTNLPPHKMKKEMAPAADRLAMCRLAVQGDTLFSVSDREITRGGASFSADTLDALRAERPDADWYLIVGADMFLSLSTWYRFADIARMASLCAAPRDGAGFARLEEYAATLRAQGARCELLDLPVMAVSSTGLRRRLAAGEDTGDWLPQEVAEYIARRGLYREKKEMQALMTDEQYSEILRGRLTEKRFHHSLEVAKEARRLAEKYGADPDRAYTAGLVHDIMKDTDKKAQLQILADFGILQDDVEKQAPKLWHAHCGAVFLEKVLGMEDREILSAVRYHTTARAGMSLLEKILYLADFTSADRDYDDVDEMRRLVEIGIAPAMLYALRYSIRDLIDQKKAIHPDTLAAYNEMVTGLDR